MEGHDFEEIYSHSYVDISNLKSVYTEWIIVKVIAFQVYCHCKWQIIGSQAPMDFGSIVVLAKDLNRAISWETGYSVWK